MPRRLLPPPDVAITGLPAPHGDGLLAAQDWYDFFRDIEPAPSTVNSLPAPGTVGRRSFVTDATVATFGSIVASGGAVRVPVYDDGINWRIG
jgi:hypothetical protein